MYTDLIKRSRLYLELKHQYSKNVNNTKYVNY